MSIRNIIRLLIRIMIVIFTLNIYYLKYDLYIAFIVHINEYILLYTCIYISRLSRILHVYLFKVSFIQISKNINNS
jgi:hypothetical protein